MPKYIYLIIFAIVIIWIIFLIPKKLQAPIANQLKPINNLKTTMKLTSPDFTDGATIPSDFTCDGNDKIPTLIISEVPSSAKSLALIMDDPDSPSGNWTHWLIWNIPAATKELSVNNIPSQAIQGKNDFGNNGYGGPCPGRGEHHYQFKLYALSDSLILQTGASKDNLETEIKKYLIEQVTLTGKYQRPIKISQ